MPEFETPQPILATIELNVGSVRIAAGARTDTVVEVRPNDRSDPRDVATAQQARVAFAAGELVVSAPNPRGFALGGGAVVIDIELPTGSRVRGDALAADFVCVGRLGECRLSTDCGHIEVDQAGPLHLTSILGNVTVAHAHGDVEALAEGGDVHIRVAEAGVQLNRTKGNSEIGEVRGDVRVYADSGDLHIGRAHAEVEARASQGDIRIDETTRGPLVLETASGKLEVGVALGVPTLLDLDSHVGTVYRSLDLVVPGACADRSDAVHIHAHTIIGDIVVRRTSYDLDDGSWP
ncbi:hypothetical protein STENM327S_08362 [Streptomyces tendae]